MRSTSVVPLPGEAYDKKSALGSGKPAPSRGAVRKCIDDPAYGLDIPLDVVFQMAAA